MKSRVDDISRTLAPLEQCNQYREGPVAIDRRRDAEGDKKNRVGERRSRLELIDLELKLSHQIMMSRHPEWISNEPFVIDDDAKQGYCRNGGC
jgi:hypothetical protein